MDILLAPHNLPFLIALVVVAVWSVLQLLLGVGDAISLDADFDVDGDGLPDHSPFHAILDFLGLGRLPFGIWLILAGFSFAVCGFASQILGAQFLGKPFPAVVASGIALLASIPLVKIAGVLLKPILPQDHTEAVSLSSLVGREAQITVGTAKRGKPAEARVLDQWGHPHYVMVEPETVGAEFPAGSKILLVAKHDHLFRATDFSEARELSE